MTKVGHPWRLVTEYVQDMKPLEKTQIAIAIIITVTWCVAALIATFDGTAALKATTPLVTLMFGWIFASRVSER